MAELGLSGNSKQQSKQIPLQKKNTGGDKMSIKGQIEEKQQRLQRFVNLGLLTQAKANEQVLRYARLLGGILGD